MFQNAEGDVEEFAHDGAADSENMELSAFKDCNPGCHGSKGAVAITLGALAGRAIPRRLRFGAGVNESLRSNL
jgi:hypothetical protein